MIKITYTPHIFANFYIGSCVRTFRPFHSTKYKLHVIHGYSLHVAKTWAVKKKEKKEENWTHEGPRYSKEKEKKFGHMKVQCVSKER